MNIPSIDWPSNPRGIRSAEQFNDAELSQLVTSLRDGNDTDWFCKTTPLDEPPQVDDLPTIVQQDILQDYRDNRNAAPEIPTESYRQIALEYFTAIQELREEIKPESLTSLADLPSGITRKTKKEWIFYGVTDEIEPCKDDIPISFAEDTRGGKYLFFTPARTAALERIIFEQFKSRPFESAKVPTTINQREEIVLCLYFEDDRYKKDLRRRYQNEENSWGAESTYVPTEPTIKPRGYKIGR